MADHYKNSSDLHTCSVDNAFPRRHVARFAEHRGTCHLTKSRVILCTCTSNPCDAGVLSDSDAVMRAYAVIMTLSNLSVILVLYGGSDVALRFMYRRTVVHLPGLVSA